MTRRIPIMNAHAGGLWCGVPYTNCREACVSSYKQGARSLELDILLTADGRYVASHDFWRVSNVDSKVFLKECHRHGWFRRRGTPMDIVEIARLANKLIGVELMFDLHGAYEMYDRQVVDASYTYDYKRAVGGLVREIDELGIFSRSVIECYSPQHVLEAESIGASRLQLWIDPENKNLPSLKAMDMYPVFCAKHHVIAVSMPGRWLRQHNGRVIVDMFHNNGIKVYSSAWESRAEREIAAQMGIDYITVDRCRPLSALGTVVHELKHQLLDTGSSFRKYVRNRIPGAWAFVRLTRKLAKRG